MSLTSIVLIGCGIASLWAWSGSTQSIWYEWGLAPYRMRENHEWYRLLTSLFFHADILHLLLNGVVFHSFGSEMEAFYGKKLYVMLLLAGALGSGMLTYLKYNDNPVHVSIGLSGVVNAVVFSFIVQRPSATLLVWFIPLPAWLFAILYLAYSLYEAQRGGSYINHWAHLGGAAAGVIFAYLV
ncbi:MAG: rhomboid family intramembrane serine protease [Bacteroidia bacterium]|nr:rhomboid family intramembrane serine protease [Bacteroidia bacterium]MCX7764374.1 rhomboid family intramembrane serine protease [Bacteroidia bacterium]MDW8057930.1 rhomboid family intramembrane serine protease [Bacteroidia bacterium]